MKPRLKLLIHYRRYDLQKLYDKYTLILPVARGTDVINNISWHNFNGTHNCTTSTWKPTIVGDL